MKKNSSYYKTLMGITWFLFAGLPIIFLIYGLMQPGDKGGLAGIVMSLPLLLLVGAAIVFFIKKAQEKNERE